MIRQFTTRKILLSSKWTIRSTLSTTTAATTTPSLYNSLSKQLEPMPPTHDPVTHQRRPLTWYSCGPTVYDDTHLGHARSYVSTDILRRVMTNFFGYHVYYVLGMTDVDDKIIQRSLELNVSAASLAKKHEREFFEDLEALNCDAPNTITRVTEHMPDIIEYIETITKHGNAYELDDGIYFDVASLGDRYGKQLGTPDSRTTNGGNEEATSMKRDQRDFALWKKIDTTKEATATTPVVAWDSPWGRGRPGWHIECSAMTNTVLGQQFDLHSGGIDLCFPHHCNEIAQANSFNQSDDWVSVFVHTGHLHIDGLKMSKSLKNFITVRQLLGQTKSTGGGAEDAGDVGGDGGDGGDGGEMTQLRTVLGEHVTVAQAFRMFVLSHHYRSNLTYSLDRMRDASADVKRFNAFLSTMEAYVAVQKERERKEETDMKDGHSGIVITPGNRRSRQTHHTFFTTLRNDTDQAIYNALSNDVDTPKVLTALRAMCSTVHRYMATHQQEFQHPDKEEDLVDVPSELILGACTTITATFDQLGLDVRPFAGDGGAMGGGGGTVSGEQEVVEAFASFRASVRDLVQNKAGPGEYYALCDEVRDVVGPKIGWEFIDARKGGVAKLK